MEREISIQTINKIKMCLLRIYEAENDKYEDDNYYKIIAANQRAIRDYIKDYSNEQRREILHSICWYNDNCSASLEKFGWKIIKKELEKKKKDLRKDIVNNEVQKVINILKNMIDDYKRVYEKTLKKYSKAKNDKEQKEIIDKLYQYECYGDAIYHAINKIKKDFREEDK